MATFLQLEDYFARFTGESGATAIDSSGADLLNDANKELAARIPLECNKKTATCTISSGSVDLPADFDYAHTDKIQVYTYTSTTKYEYNPVTMDEFSSYDTSDYVYAIDYENKHIKAPSDVALTVVYYAVPATITDTATIILFPIPQAIARLAAGNFFQSIDEDPDQAKVNFQIADALIAQAELLNKKAKTYKGIRPYGGKSIGFNS